MAHPTWMAVVLAATLLPGTATPSSPAPPADRPVPEWVESWSGGGELRFTAPTGEAYRVWLEPGPVLLDDLEDDVEDTTVVLRGTRGDAAAAMVVTENEVRLLANIPGGSYRYDPGGGKTHPGHQRGLIGVTWQGSPL